ncbi:MAG: hypothetical protein IPN53_13975 [Comamonadaceae bacterium]|nr:hypothetical protein [Comamonadaceae bacterium]
MRQYKDATVEMWAVGVGAMASQQCEVCLGDHGEIEVTYQGASDGIVSYEGMEHDEGHYLLESTSPDGRASLHRFSGGLILEGYWEAGGERGMWRITLVQTADRVFGKETGDSSDNDDVRRVADLPDDDDEVEDDWASKPRRYKFPLRNDWDVFLRLPDDLTRREGKRLAAFIKSLAHYDH